MKEDKKADRAARKEERSGNRDGVEKGKKKQRERGSAGVQKGKCRQRLGEKKLTGEEGLGVQQGNINI